MGHWSEALLEEAAARVGTGVDDPALKEALAMAANHIEILAGRKFGTSEQLSVTIVAGDLPFVHVPDIQIGHYESDTEAWPVPDPVHGEVASVLQMRKPASLASKASEINKALRLAGHFVAAAHKDGRLSREYPLWWLGRALNPEQRAELIKHLVYPTSRVEVPIAMMEYDGWWFQITRRMVWLTKYTRDDRLLAEPLVPEDGEDCRLLAFEPILVIARATQHPVDWAVAMRIWPTPPCGTDGRPWPPLAKAIHGYGIPVITLDGESNAEEIACQILLLAHWHGYTSTGGLDIAEAISAAYPKIIERIRRATRAPSNLAASAMLLEGLLHPGFDPERGAESVRHYMNRKASIVIRNHHKIERPGERIWEQLGLKERAYYKLLKRFSTQEAAKHEVSDEVLERIRQHLHRREQRKAALDLLVARGFSVAGARKWLQRHPMAQVRTAKPRASNPDRS